MPPLSRADVSKRFNAVLAAVLACGAWPVSVACAQTPLMLHYNQPATKAMDEALPLGNGRLGAMVFGTPAAERIVLNDITLWTGDDNPTGDNTKKGAYQCLADLGITLPGHEAATAYRRDLDIGTAVASVAYQVNGVGFRREVFVSHPADVVVVRLTADAPGVYTGRITLADKHGFATTVDNGHLTIAGTLSNGMIFETRAAVVATGGKAIATADAIDLTGCDSVTIVVAGGTNYSPDYDRGYRGENPHARIIKTLAAAIATPVEKLKADHVANFRTLFDRVTLDLGKSSDAVKALTTDQRKLAAATRTDPEMDALIFQLGRYFLISSSRPGSLPANLQGLWNEKNDPAWNSDYHTNINVQMNYWPAEVTNLAECHAPFFDMMRSQAPAWRKTTAASPEMNTPDGKPTSRGFSLRTSHNITGGMGWKWDRTANAWYCQHLWEHYAFGQDKTYLRDVAFPIMKEIVGFWQDHLKALPDGRLVVPNSWSPEHGPTEDGVTYAQQIVDDLFLNYVEACDALNIDRGERDQVAAMRAKLVRPGIGSWGQLLEWMDEKKAKPGDKGEDSKLDTPRDDHRHTSHLFGVFPGRSITTTATPALAEAAKVSLRARGNAGDVREWSFAWRTALWARFGDGNSAYGQLRQFFSARNSCPNLFGLHPPMQIDGNFGSTAAIAEMLLQSHDGQIVLLPALPDAWPTGSVRGLRARGGVTVDLTWAAGELTSVTLTADTATQIKVRRGTRMIDFPLSAKTPTRLTAGLLPVRE